VNDKTACVDHMSFYDSLTESHAATVRVTLTMPPITYRGEVIVDFRTLFNRPSFLTERMSVTVRVGTAETTCRMRLNQRGFNTTD
jgi:hypothetical protein